MRSGRRGGRGRCRSRTSGTTVGRARQASRSRAAQQGLRRRVSSSTAATSSTPAPSRLARVASSTLRKPWCSKPVSRVAVPHRVVQPGRALERELPVEGGGDAGRELGAVGNASASAPPVRSLSRWSTAATSSSAASQSGVGRCAVQPGHLDGHRHLVVELAGGDQLVDGGDDPAGVVGELAGRASRAGRSPARAASRRPSPGRPARPPARARPRRRRRRRRRPSGVRQPRSTTARAGRAGARPRPRAVRPGRRTATPRCSRWARTASSSGALPGGNMAASSTRPAKAAGIRGRLVDTLADTNGSLL